MESCFASLSTSALAKDPVRAVGRVVALSGERVTVSGLRDAGAIGDRVDLCPSAGPLMRGEIVRLDPAGADILVDGDLEGVALGDAAVLTGPPRLAPSDAWIGRVIDPDGAPLDGRPLMSGAAFADLKRAAPPIAERRGLGARLSTGMAVFDTLLPIVAGQRVGLFAGSGVGKSRLLAALARRVEADVVVLALIGERGREVGDFARNVLGPEGLARSVVVAAPSDRPALTRRRCALSAMAVAEYFRDQGRSVLLLADSLTRFAEAHRDVVLSAGGRADLSGFPASLTHQLMALCERAGPGVPGKGDITALFTVLVAGSDMDGIVADTLRGVLDGHVVLTRDIAERGRFPAIDVLKSVSRSLPEAASEPENRLIGEARRLLGRYERAELMIQSGLYTRGNDALTDRAIACWPALDAFVSRDTSASVAESFEALRACLDPENGAAAQEP